MVPKRSGAVSKEAGEAGPWGRIGPLIVQRWERLTQADLQATAGVRADLARRIARQYHIPVGEAKRQVHRFLRAVAAGGGDVLPDEGGSTPPSTGEIDDLSGMEEAEAERAAAEPSGGLAGESGEVEDR